MALELERMFGLLLSPDTQVIRQATAELQAIHKDPALIGALCEVLLHSTNPHARQFSAVLLRKKLGKVWKKLSEEERGRFKVILVQSLTNEFHNLVLRAVANLVSVIANYEYTHGQWAELSQFIMQCYQSDNPAHREVGLMVLSSVLDSAALQLQPQFTELLTLLSSALEDTQNDSVPFYALKALTSMVECIGDDETALFRQIIPKSMEAIKRLIISDEDRACEAMDLFDELIEIEVGVVVPYLQPLLEFCLEIGSNVELGDGIRVRALTTIMWLVSAKKKSVLKKGLIPSLLTALLNIMITYNGQCDTGDSDCNESDLLEDKVQLPHSVASQVIDRLSLSLPADKIFNPMLQLIHPWLQNDASPSQRRTALTAVAVMSEGCSEIIKKTHLAMLVQCVHWSMRDSHQGVRNSALFALGQFSEHLQPEIIQYSSHLLPALFQFLEETLTTRMTADKSSVTRIFYALETFCENLGDQLIPYLPGLMEKLFQLLMGDFNVHYKELAISCIGAIANAVESQIVPYFAKSVQVLKEFILLPQQQDFIVVQAQAIDTLGILATAVGGEVFRPLAEECVQLGIVLMQSTDPDLRRSVYGMLASLSGVLKGDMLPHLQAIVPKMLECLQSEEGVKAKYSSTAIQFLDFNEDEESGIEDLNDSQLSLEDDQDIEGYTVENSYLEEKEDACNAIGEMARNLGVAFIPLIDDCFKEINVMTEDSVSGIRKASITAITELCFVWYDPIVISRLGKDEKFGLDKLINATLLDMSAGARTDNDPLVVVTTLENLEKLLKKLNGRGLVIDDRVVESLLVTVDDIFSSKAQCQEDEESEGLGGFDDGEIAEMDGLVLENAGCILGPLAKLVGGAKILNNLKPLIDKLVSKISINSPTSERSFVIGTLAEIIDGCGTSSIDLFEHLYPIIMLGVSDKEDDVVSNSVYGLGVLISNGVPKTIVKYPEVLQILFNLLQTRQYGRLIDNICASVCRLIVAHRSGVPLDQVIPVLLQNLPLKLDYDENDTVYNCILTLLEEGNTSVINNIDLVLKAFSLELLPSSKLSDELKERIIEIIKALSTQCTQQFQSAIASLPHDQVQTIATVLSSPPYLQNGNAAGDNIC